MSIRDFASILDVGLHSAFLFLDGIGRTEFARAHDPIPAGARAISFNRRLRGDPFSEPSRPLVLTLASDCADLASDVRGRLLSLSRFPGVAIVRAADVPDHGYREPATVTVKADAAWLDITVRQSDAS